MRMWMTDPKIMCKNHLLGEHRELHMFCGALRKKQSISGYLMNGLLDPRYIQSRYLQISEEFQRRGYIDFTPLELPDFSYLGLNGEPCFIDAKSSLEELLRRCPGCQRRYNENKM